MEHRLVLQLITLLTNAHLTRSWTIHVSHASKHHSQIHPSIHQNTVGHQMHPSSFIPDPGPGLGGRSPKNATKNGVISVRFAQNPTTEDSRKTVKIRDLRALGSSFLAISDLTKIESYFFRVVLGLDVSHPSRARTLTVFFSRTASQRKGPSLPVISPFESFMSLYANVSNVIRRGFRTVCHNLRRATRWFLVWIYAVKGGYLDETISRNCPYNFFPGRRTTYR